ncbi:hypothetical protein OXX69_011726 [Metschnikowia pulcherrima]
MSRQTLARIPKEVQHIFKVYETAAQLYRPYDDKLVSQFVDKTGSYYDMFNRHKLMGGNGDEPIFNSRDFPPVTRDIVSRIFESPLDLEPRLAPSQISTKIEDPIFSERNRTAKHFSDYQARIVSLFASYFQPLRTVASLPDQKSLKWYSKLLANTPVIFFLSQRQRLMAEPSLRGINQPLQSLQRDLDSICEKYVDDTDIDKRIRNYHLTDLISTDIFTLAVENEYKNFEKYKLENCGNDMGLPKDGLCARFRDWRRLMLFGPDVLPISQRTLKKSNIMTKYPISQIEDALSELDDTQKLPKLFPYDVQYNDLFMLTIEEPVIGENHKDLLDLLANLKGFEIVAVRMSQTDKLQSELTSESQSGMDPVPRPTYEQLLKWAEKQHSNGTAGHVPQLLERIGEWGLVEVEENQANSAFYVCK